MAIKWLLYSNRLNKWYTIKDKQLQELTGQEADPVQYFLVDGLDVEPEVSFINQVDLPSVVAYSAAGFTSAKANVYGLPQAQLLFTKGDTLLSTDIQKVYALYYMPVNTNISFIVSPDSGTTWFTHTGTQFVPIALEDINQVLLLGINPIKLDSISADHWATLFSGKPVKKCRWGFVLQSLRTGASPSVTEIIITYRAE